MAVGNVPVRMDFCGLVVVDDVKREGCVIAEPPDLAHGHFVRKAAQEALGERSCIPCVVRDACQPTRNPSKDTAALTLVIPLRWGGGSIRDVIRDVLAGVNPCSYAHSVQVHRCHGRGLRVDPVMLTRDSAQVHVRLRGCP